MDRVTPEKRILMVGHVDLSKDDAPKVHFMNLANAFREHGSDIRCLLYSPDEDDLGYIAENVFIRFTPNPLKGNILSRIIKYIIVIPYIMTEIYRFKPQMIYYRYSPPVSLYLMLIMIFKISPFSFKIVLEFDDWVSSQRMIQSENKIKIFIINLLQILAALLADNIRVVTEGLKDKIMNYGFGKVKISHIGNGTDTKFFVPMDKIKAREEIGIDTQYIYAGFIGNFAIWQGLEYLIHAIPEVMNRNDKIRFLLVGDGPEMSEIRRELLSLNIESVIITGRIPYRKANIYINTFDIGLAPFIIERNEEIGLSPLKIRDYAACGIPIIASRIRGLEIIEKENFGVLIPPEDSDVLAENILKLASDKELREIMGKNGRKIAEEEFRWEIISKKILDLIL